MSKLITAVCLFSLVGFVLTGCTPESEESWSGNLDFSDLDPRIGSVSGTYEISNNIDDRFTTLTILQTGGTLQGYDNMRRSWSGTITGQSDSLTDQTHSGQINLQTSDGPTGQAVIVGKMVVFVVTVGDEEVCYAGFDAVFYSGDKSGWIQGMGAIVDCEIEEED